MRGGGGREVYIYCLRGRSPLGAIGRLGFMLDYLTDASLHGLWRGKKLVRYHTPMSLLYRSFSTAMRFLMYFLDLHFRNKKKLI